MKNIKIKSIIKKLSLALLVLTAFTFTACENSFSKQEENKASVGYLKIVLKDQLKSRTVLPDLSTSNLTDIHLSVLYDGETEYEEIANWANASKIKNVALEPCSGYFKLTATCNGCTFQDTKYAEIYFAQISPVAFTLYTDASFGGLDLKITFPQEAAIAELSLINEHSGNVITPSEDLAIQGTSGNHYVQYIRDLHDSSEGLGDGTYFIEIKFYGDSSKTILLNTYYELIRIRNGFISSATRTIDLNNLYTITYYSDGGSPVSGTLQQNYSMHSGEIALPDLQKAGFIFEGWYDNPSFTGSVKTSIPAGSSGPLKYYALFTIELKEGPDFNATLKTWQASNPEKIVASLTAPDDSITISQYLDTGTSVPVWYDSAEHSIKYFADGYTNGTKRLKMRPDSNSMFMNMGQSMQIIEISVFDTSAVTNMFQMFFGNINLEAIYVSSAFTTDTVVNSTDMFASCSNKLKGEKGFTWSSTNAMDKTYAKIDTDSVDGYFCSNPASEIYYITYHCGTNPDGTNAASNPVSYTENTLPISLSAPARTKVMSASLSTAYQFVDWYKNADYSGEPITSISKGTTGNLNLYAKWKAPYRVEHSFENAADSLTYDVNDTCTELYYGLVGDATQAVPLTDASYSGSVTLPSDINGFEAITPVSQKTINDNGETITTVKYNRKEFTITYDLNGGNISGSTALKTQTGKYGTAVPSLTGIKKAGYSLENWKNSSDGTIGDLPETFPAENRTYIAQWTPITYQIVYELDDGAFVSGYPETAATTYKVTEETTLPAATQVTKDYMHLEGWYDNASFTGEPLTELTENSDIIELADANNKIHLYAKWALDPVSLTVTPGFPGNYVCQWRQSLSGSTRTINIIVKDSSTGTPLEVGTTAGTLNNVSVGIYEGADCVKTETGLSFTYPSYLDPPSGTPFYVRFNVQVDATTAYSYDYWPEQFLIGSKPKPDAVGDIVFNDGSAMPYTDFDSLNTASKNEKKSAAIALIFYKGRGLNSDATDGTPDTTTERTLGVGLKQGEDFKWCTNGAEAYSKNIATIQCTGNEIVDPPTFTGDKNGSDNLEQIEAFEGVNDTSIEANYPAFYFAKNYKEQRIGIESSSRIPSGSEFERGWYLPSLAELFQIYANGKGSAKVFDINAASQALGGDVFNNTSYLSSSQYASDDVKSCRYDGWGCGHLDKDDDGSICCIREF